MYAQTLDNGTFPDNFFVPIRNCIVFNFHLNTYKQTATMFLSFRFFFEFLVHVTIYQLKYKGVKFCFEHFFLLYVRVNRFEGILINLWKVCLWNNMLLLLIVHSCDEENCFYYCGVKMYTNFLEGYRCNEPNNIVNICGKDSMETVLVHFLKIWVYILI